jgi:photosystem II stability/assembly factor-like uncharacterized protein
MTFKNAAPRLSVLVLTLTSSFAPIGDMPLHAQGSSVERSSEDAARSMNKGRGASRDSVRRAVLKHRGEVLRARDDVRAADQRDAALLSDASVADKPLSPASSRNGDRTRVAVREIGPEFGPSFAVAGFIINRENPRQILLPTARRIFRSSNGGRHWFPVDLVSRRGFADGTFFVRRDPGNPNVLFAVKESLFSPGVAEQGLYRSTDFGTTWTRLESISETPADCAINEASSSEVLVLSQFPLEHEPVWRSDDGGVTFEPQIGTGLPKGILDEESGEFLVAPIYTNIATTPADPNIVYVVLYLDEAGVYSPAVYKSVDRGRTFSRLEGSPPRPLQVFPHPTRANVVFVQNDGASPNIYRSLDGGESFEPVTTGLPADKVNFFVAFDAGNPSFVFVAGEGGLFRSTNGGDRFQPLGLTDDQLGFGATTGSVDPTDPGVIYVNTYRGNFKSVNGGATFMPINGGWRAASARHIAFDNDRKPNLYVAASSGGGILRTRNRGPRYERVPHPSELDGTAQLAIAPTDPDTIFAGTGDGLWRTSDGGRSWARAEVDPASVVFTDEAEIAVDPTDANNVYFVTASRFGSPGFYRSTDAGSTFQRTYFDPDVVFGTRLTDLAIDPRNPTVIFAGSGAIFGMDAGPLRSADGGVSFSSGPLQHSTIKEIVIDPNDPDTVYLAGIVQLVAPGPCGPGGCPPPDPNRAVVRSTDGGTTYSPADAGLQDPSVPSGVVRVIGMVIDPRDSRRLYLWTTSGLFRTTDRGTSWTLLEGDQTVRVAGYGNTIAIDPQKPNRLYLAGAAILEVEVGRDR